MVLQGADATSSNGDGSKPTFPAYQQAEGAGNPSLPRVPATGPGTKLMHPDEDVSMVSSNNYDICHPVEIINGIKLANLFGEVWQIT